MKLSQGADLTVAAILISGGSALTPVSAVAASKVAENSQSPGATDFSAQRRYYRHYGRYGYSPRYYRPRYYGSYGRSYGYPGYYGGYGPGYYGGSLFGRAAVSGFFLFFRAPSPPTLFLRGTSPNPWRERYPPAPDAHRTHL